MESWGNWLYFCILCSRIFWYVLKDFEFVFLYFLVNFKVGMVKYVLCVYWNVGWDLKDWGRIYNCIK